MMLLYYNATTAKFVVVHCSHVSWKKVNLTWTDDKDLLGEACYPTIDVCDKENRLFDTFEEAVRYMEGKRDGVLF